MGDKGRECLYMFYTPAVFLQRASISGTVAFLMNAKRRAVAAQYFLGMVTPSLTVLVILVCCHYVGGKWTYQQLGAKMAELGIAAFELSGSILAAPIWILHGQAMLGELFIFSGPDEHFDPEALGVYYVKQSILYLTIFGVVLSPFNLVVVVVDLYREMSGSGAEVDQYEELYAVKDDTM